MDDPSSAFIVWCAQNGVVAPKVQSGVLCPDGQRGCLALQDIEEHEVIMSVPTKLLITKATALESAVGHVFTDNPELFSLEHTSDYEDRILSIYLLYERAQGVRSFWHVYLATLSLSDCLFEWSQEELEQLQNPQLAADALSRAEALKKVFDELHILTSLYPTIFPPKSFTMDTFKWAWLIVQTRAFARRIATTTLVPFVDNLNHGNVHVTYQFDFDNNMFNIITGEQTFQAGEQVLFSYGRRDNADLLMEYGFVLSDNEWNQVELNLCASSTLLSAQDITDLLDKYGMQTTQSITLSNRTFNSELLTFHRCLVAKSTHASLLDKPQPLEDESVILQLCYNLLHNCLYRFATTIEEDELALQHSLPFRTRCAILYRLGVKQIFRKHMQMLEIAHNCVFAFDHDFPAPIPDNTSSMFPADFFTYLDRLAAIAKR